MELSDCELMKKAVLAHLIANASAYKTRLDLGQNAVAARNVEPRKYITIHDFKPGMRRQLGRLHDRNSFTVGPVRVKAKVTFKRKNTTVSHLAKHLCAEGGKAAIGCFRLLIKVHTSPACL